MLHFLLRQNQIAQLLDLLVRCLRWRECCDLPRIVGLDHRLQILLGNLIVERGWGRRRRKQWWWHVDCWVWWDVHNNLRRWGRWRWRCRRWRCRRWWCRLFDHLLHKFLQFTDLAHDHRIRSCWSRWWWCLMHCLHHFPHELHRIHLRRWWRWGGWHDHLRWWTGNRHVHLLGCSRRCDRHWCLPLDCILEGVQNTRHIQCWLGCRG